jgi:multicomponent Na+:H+ antiporter subunit G
MIALAQEFISGLLLAAGSLFLLVGAVGVLRFPDFYTRLHPAGITDTAGAGLIVAGLVVLAGFTLISAKLLIVLAFVVFTSPISCHATARAARAAGLKPLLADEAAGEKQPSKP